MLNDDGKKKEERETSVWILFRSSLLLTPNNTKANRTHNFTRKPLQMLTLSNESTNQFYQYGRYHKICFNFFLF